MTKYDDPTDISMVAFCMASQDPSVSTKPFSHVVQIYPDIINGAPKGSKKYHAREVAWQSRQGKTGYTDWKAKAKACVKTAKANGIVVKPKAAAVTADAEDDDEDDLPLTELNAKKKGISSAATANASTSTTSTIKTQTSSAVAAPAAKKQKTTGDTGIDGDTNIIFPSSGIVDVTAMPDGEFRVMSQDNNAATVTAGILPSVVKTMILASGPGPSSVALSTGTSTWSVKVAEYGNGHFIIRSKGGGEGGGGLAVVTADILGVIVAALSDAPAPGVGQAPPAAPTGPIVSQYAENGIFGFLV